MITIPPERENMSNLQLRKLAIEIAERVNEMNSSVLQEPSPDLHPLDHRVQESMESNLIISREEAQHRQEAKWSAGRIRNNLTNPQGIQWPIDKLDDDMRRQIIEQDASLLESVS